MIFLIETKKKCWVILEFLKVAKIYIFILQTPLRFSD
jgi:hypothetical protein